MTSMREHPAEARRRGARGVVFLPADEATVATSLSGGPMIVAHTGRAHLGLDVDRALLRQLERARSATPAVREDAGACPSRGDLPDAIAFRHATSYTLAVSDRDIHLTLHATGDAWRPDVHVELRVDRGLVESLAQHQTPHVRINPTAALAALLVVVCAVIAPLALMP